MPENSSPSKRPLETRFNFDLCTLYSKLPALMVTFMTKDRTRFFLNQEKTEVKRSQSGSPESALDEGGVSGVKVSGEN